METTPPAKGSPLSVAIIGMGSLFPRAADVKAFWRVLKNSEDAITPVPNSHWSTEDYYHKNPKEPDHTYCGKGGFLSPLSYDPAEFGIPPNILEATDTSQLLSMLIAKRALKDAGYGDDRDFDRSRVSVVLGATGTQGLAIPLGARLGHPIWRRALQKAGVPGHQAEEVMQQIADAYVPWQENSFPGLLGNVIAGRISNRLNLGGTNCVVDAACASSLSALNLTLLELAAGRCDLAITGGVDTLNDIFMHMCFSQTGVLSHTSDAKPFSEEADGTVLGEGIGIIALKRLSDAERDQDRIYAVIKAIGTSSDGRSQSIYAPNADGQANALRMAYQMAGIDPNSVDLIETHGTGTRVGDAVEFSALKTVFSETERQGARCAIGSVKSNIGHTKAAAGAAGLIKATLSMYHKALPATLKADTPDPKLGIEDSPFFLNTKTRPWIASKNRPRRSGVSAFGFGGSNFHVVLEEYDKAKSRVAWDGSVEIIALSSPLKSELAGTLNRFNQSLADAITFADITRLAADTRTNFSPKDAHRLLAVLERPADAEGKELEEIRNRFAEAAAAVKDGEMDRLKPLGVHYGGREAAGGLAFLFPGQGSQYTGMGNDLACYFPQGHDIFETANALFENTPGDSQRRLSDMIFDLPAAGSPESQADEALTPTDVAQPAIGAVSAMMLAIIDYFGVEGTAATGHSFGELTALHAVGSLSLANFLEAAVMRGKFMAGDGGDRGTMLAVKAPLDTLDQLIRDNHLDVILANRNSPNQGVLSGSREAITVARDVCKKKKIRAIPLQVAAAFHSRLVADAAVPFQEFLSGISLGKQAMPLFANTTAHPYPDDEGKARKLLGEQLLNPVNFVGQIDAMYASGVRTFLEIGPKPVLTGLVKQILKGKPHTSIAMDQSAGKKSGLVDLADTLCCLAASGHEINLERWEDAVTPLEKPMMSITLTGANYRNQPTPSPTKRRVNPATPPALPAAPSAPETQSIVPSLDSNGRPVPPLSQPDFQTGKPYPPDEPAPSPAQAPQTGIHSYPVNAELTMDALKLVSESLKSLQSLQAQTAETHKKFLDAQTEASRNLQQMMARTRQLSESALGMPAVAQPLLYSDTPPTTSPIADEIRIASAEPPALPEISPPSRQSEIEAALMAVVSDLTGYPVEMLTADMDIEADLGIDSIKRVEILSSLEEKMPDLPPVSPDVMGTLKSLGAVVQHLTTAEPGQADSQVSAEPAISPSHIQSLLFDVVSDLTGYPVDMLSLNMDIEADLGIDSIKRVEILSSMEERMPDLPQVTPDIMGTLKTLGAVVDYLNETTTVPATPAVTPHALSAQAASHPQLEKILFDVVSDLTGYPVDMLSREMDIEADLGIDSIKRVEILSSVEETVPELPPISPDTIGSLKTLGAIVDYLTESGTSQSATAVREPAGAPSPETIQTALFEIVSDLTGYPVDMLTPGMDIETDLGIDSIKRVEILSAVEEKMPELPAVEPDAMSRLKTLGQIAEYLGGLSTARDAVQQADPTSTLDVSYTFPSPSPEPATGVDHRVSRRTVVLLEQPFKQNEPLPIPENRIMYVSNDKAGLGEAVVGHLTSRGIPAALLSDAVWREPETHADQLADAGGLILIPDVDPLTDRFDTARVWNDDDEAFLKLAFRTVRASAPHLMASGEAGGGVLATVTRLDGGFGFNKSDRILHPLHGGLAGLTKTAAIEWPQVNCRAIDVSPDWKDNSGIAAAVVDEILTPGPVEIGLGLDQRVILSLEASETPEGRIDLSPGDVIIVTGGAKGVTAACVYALAKHTRPTLLMIGRSAAPFPEPVWLSPLQKETDMKKAILTHDFAAKKPTPKDVEAAYRRYAANREISGNLDRLKATGATVAYQQADVRDAAALSSLMDHIRKEYGLIKGLIHGAGILEDRFIVDKTPEQFEKVFDTKARGLKYLLEATLEDNLRYIVLFSSVAGRMGNKGQVDYAMANEVLNKLGHQEALRRKDCRVISINWGPWDGGMVTPSLRREFLRQGIGLIPVDAGAMAMIYEMMGPAGSPVEVVMGAGLGGNTGTDTVTTETEQPREAETIIHTLPFFQDVDLSTYPILNAHVLGGKPVVPFALMAEWIGHAASKSYPALMFCGIEAMRVLAGIKLDNDRKRVTVAPGKPSLEDTFTKLPVELRNGDGTKGSTVHARAVAVFSKKEIPPPEYAAPEGIDANPYPLSTADVYEKILFHGKQLQGIKSISGFSDKGIRAVLGVAPQPDAWLASPFTDSWIADPLVLDTAFQMAVLWSYEHTGMVSLPSYLAEYRQYRSTFPSESVTAVLEVTTVTDHKLTGDFTFVDTGNKVIAKITGYEGVIDETLMKAFKPGD